MRWAISRSVADAIVAEAHRSPLEICGLLFGREGLIDAHRPCRNVAADPAIAFEIDPAALLAAHRATRHGGPVIVGHYHSHPSGVARPSRWDAEQSFPDNSVWLIAAAGALTAWRAVRHGELHDRFDPLALDIA